MISPDSTRAAKRSCISALRASMSASEGLGPSFRSLALRSTIFAWISSASAWVISPDSTRAAKRSCISALRASTSARGGLGLNGRSTEASVSESFQVAAAIATELPAISAPDRTMGAIHLTFGRWIIVELLNGVCVQRTTSPMKLN